MEQRPYAQTVLRDPLTVRPDNRRIGLEGVLLEVGAISAAAGPGGHRRNTGLVAYTRMARGGSNEIQIRGRTGGGER